MLTRLALTDDTKLERVLSLLLPRLLRQLTPDLHADVRGKLLEVLSHISRRLANATIALPCEDLVGIAKETSSPFSRNFALVYLDMGIARAATEPRAALLPCLLSGEREALKSLNVSKLVYTSWCRVAYSGVLLRCCLLLNV